ncbi:hypothetical protein FV241_30015 [Methylobacterium sp. WL2]|nr:hypothetical protein FV241_30015 [Methylobacterium sp. WL2]
MERTGCWVWTGYVRKERQRFRLYPTPADYGGVRNSVGSIQGERATPEVRDPQRGHRKVPAHRRVYAVLTGVHIDDVPTLARCLNEKCVSPHHVLETGPTPKEIRRRAAEIAEGISFEEPAADATAEAAPVVDVMETLKDKRPAIWVERDGAEAECGLPSGSITPEMWAEYVIWDEANPEDDEE